MATNYIQEGKSMYLVTTSEAESGDAFVVGDYLPCVLLTDADAGDSHKAAVATEGVFSLSVLANDGSPSKVNVGDILYWDDKDSPLSKVATSNKIFGIALEEVTAGDTATIKVLLNPQVATPGTIDTAQIEDSAVIASKIASAAVTLAKLHVNEVARYIPREITAPSDAGTLTATTSGFVSWTTPDSSAVTATLAVPQFLGQELTLILGTRDTTGDLEVTVAESLSLDSSNRKITFDNDGEWIKLAATDVGGDLRWVEVAKGGAEVGPA